MRRKRAGVIGGCPRQLSGAVLLLAVVVCLAPTGLCAQDAKYSCIQEVDGFAYLSEENSLSETRALAFANAKRQAVEMARTYISSQTKVSDFVLEFDRVTAESSGAVTILEQKDIGVEDNSRYHVWIRAEVEYELAGKPQAANAASTAVSSQVLTASGPLAVKVWTSKKRYREGEKIQIFLQGNRPFFARILDVTAGGEIVQLLPNDYRTINYFEAGKVYRIPDEGDRFDLTVSPPFGEDRIVVYASELPLGAVPMEAAGGGLRKYSGGIESLAAKTRGIKVMGSEDASRQSADPSGGAQFFEGNWHISTGP
jgi:hypothetical protein